jgi:hypothetical protein
MLLEERIYVDGRFIIQDEALIILVEATIRGAALLNAWAAHE